MGRLTGVLGILAILLFAYLFSTDRKAIRPRTVLVGLALQICFAILVLRVSFGVRVMSILGAGANKLLSYSTSARTFCSAIWAVERPSMASSSPSRFCPSSFSSLRSSPFSITTA